MTYQVNQNLISFPQPSEPTWNSKKFTINLDITIENNYNNPIDDFINRLRTYLFLNNDYRYNYNSCYSNKEYSDFSFIVPTTSSLSSLEFLKLIEYTNLSEITEFFNRHGDILNIVITGCSMACGKFKKNGKLYLEVFHDPSDGDEYLTLNVRQKEYPSNFMEQIKEISNFFRSELAEKSSYFLITTDFIPENP